jgi:stage II sporulation protein D
VKGGAFIAALCALVAAAPAGAGTKLVVTGHGWGHGVGMSQWGAYGYARHGWGWRRILAHYYGGTQVSPAPVSRVRVLLTERTQRARVGCAGAIRVNDASGRGRSLPPGSYGLGRALMLPVGHRKVRVRDGRRHRETFALVAVERALRPPLVLDCPSAPLTLDGRAYHGLLVVRRTGKALSVVNSLPLDEYVRGVVGGEMPDRWSIAALEAQAVAARSYALATLKPGERFDLYADTRSQVYGGIAYETPRTNAAVDRTAGKVLTWNGRVATTYFFSTSGGRTADVREVWPKAPAVPYLRSVDDPYDGASPHHLWGPVVLDLRRVDRKLGVTGGDVSVARSPSGRVESVRIGGRLVDADRFRTRLGLASTWFDVGELSLAGDRRQVSFGGRLELETRAEGVGRALLERRIGAGRWKTLKAVRGSARVAVEPRAQTVYRLDAAGVHGPVFTVAVAPLLHVTPAGAALLDGTVEPRSRGALTVTRRIGGGWKVVARPRLDTRGRFHVPLLLRRGAYRIVLAGDGRYAETSRNLVVTPRLLTSLSLRGSSG